MKVKLTKEEKKALKEERKKQGRGLIAEFKKFITRGNVVDMAVGVIIAGAFTKIVNAFTQGIIMPVVNYFVYLIVGDKPLSEITTILKAVYTVDENGNVTDTLDTAKSIIMNWGTLIQAIIDFLLIAIVLFAILKTFNSIKDKKAALVEKLKKKEEEEKASEPQPEPVPAAPPAPTTNELLGEIIDILKSQKEVK